MTYEDLLSAADSLGLITREKDLQAYDGRIKGRRVAIRRSIPTQKKKACVLAEELGHYFTSSGNILDLDDVTARKQERRARLWAFNVQIGLSGLIHASNAGCHNLYETAEFLNVPERFLSDCLQCYREKYGPWIRHDEYVICFDPYLEVLTEQEAMSRINDW